MNENYLTILVQKIVKQASELKDKRTDEANAPVNYAAVFAQSQREYDELLAAAKRLGKIIRETPTGLLFNIEPLDTVAGKLRLLKIRIPDMTRLERGDADFTVADYPKFKRTYLKQPGFKLIEREDFEIIELMDSNFNVRAYFSHPPLDQQLGLSSKKKVKL